MSRRVPKLRFKEFSGEWEEKKLGDTGNIITGTTPSTKKEIYYKNGIYPWVTPTDITEKKDITETKKYLTQEGLEAGRYIPKNSLLITCIASIGKNVILRQDGSCNQQINAIIPYKEFNVDFLYYLIENNVHVLLENAGQGGMAMLNKSDFSNLLFLFPKDPREQQKIANTLSSLDNLIEAGEKKVKALKKHKKGLMQQLFPQEGEKTPKLRFEEFSGEWEENEYGKIFDRITSKKYQIKSDEYLKKGKYPVIDQGKTKIIAYSNDKKKLFINDGIIIFGDHTRILKYIDFNFIVGADGTQLIKAKKSYNNKFLYYQLLTKKIPNTGYNRHFKFIKDMLFLIPPTIKEQQKIADTLSSLDNLIEAGEKKVEALKKHKKGLMQQMFVSEE